MIPTAKSVLFISEGGADFTRRKLAYLPQREVSGITGRRVPTTKKPPAISPLRNPAGNSRDIVTRLALSSKTRLSNL